MTRFRQWIRDSRARWITNHAREKSPELAAQVAEAYLPAQEIVDRMMREGRYPHGIGKTYSDALRTVDSDEAREGVELWRKWQLLWGMWERENPLPRGYYIGALENQWVIRSRSRASTKRKGRTK